MVVAAGLVLIWKIYAGLGLIMAVAFLGWGIERIDPAARGAFAFRPLLVPGLILIWPLVLWRWRAALA